MKVIILAAGRGHRLLPLTENIPKCMIQFNGKSLLEHQIDVLKKFKFKKINLVCGYLQNKINFSFINKINNKDYLNTNMVYSLFCAVEEMTCNEDLLITYGDIIYEESVISKILEYDAPIVISADKNWRKYWSARIDNIINDIESFKSDKHHKVTELGKKVTELNEINGQYIGIIKIRKDYIEALIKIWEHILKNGSINNIDAKQIYMTDFLQYLITKNIPIYASFINSGWLEFDTVEDIHVYNKLLEENKLNQFFCF